MERIRKEMCLDWPKKMVSIRLSRDIVGCGCVKAVE